MSNAYCRWSTNITYRNLRLDERRQQTIHGVSDASQHRLCQPYTLHQRRIFQDNAPKSEIDQEIKNVELGGGKITQRFDSDIMKGFAAQLPENLVLTYTQLTSNKDHKYLCALADFFMQSNVADAAFFAGLQILHRARSRGTYDGCRRKLDVRCVLFVCNTIGDRLTTMMFYISSAPHDVAVQTLKRRRHEG